MRRIFGRYGVVAVALLAMATWSGNSFGREKDASNDSTSNAQSNASNDDSQNASQNNNDRRNQDRDQSDADAQHHAALGISVVDNDGRVRVVAILPGSPAARAGLQVGDEIRSVDDQRIRTADGLTEEVGEKQPGSNVELSIRRNGERRTLQARLVSSQEVRQNNRQYASNDGNRGNRQNGWNQNQYQNGWNRNRASSYDPNAQSGSQSVNQQIRQLRQQVAQLQQEVDELRNQSADGARVGYRNRSNNASRDGGQTSGNDRSDRNSDQESD